MVSAPYAHNTTAHVASATIADNYLDTNSSGMDATPAVPARAAGAMTVDPQTHEDIWYALCLMRPCYPMSDYGLGLALLSQMGLSEEQARAIMAADKAVA